MVISVWVVGTDADLVNGRVYLEEVEVVEGEVVQHSPVHTGLCEGILVLRQPYVVQPARHPRPVHRRKLTPVA